MFTHAQPEMSNAPREASPEGAAEKNSSTDGQRKNRGIGSFFQKKWQAMKRAFTVGHRGKVQPMFEEHPDEPKPGPSSSGPVKHKGPSKPKQRLFSFGRVKPKDPAEPQPGSSSSGLVKQKGPSKPKQRLFSFGRVKPKDPAEPKSSPSSSGQVKQKDSVKAQTGQSCPGPIKHKGPVKAQPGPSSPGPVKQKGPAKAGQSSPGLVKNKGPVKTQPGPSSPVPVKHNGPVKAQPGPSSPVPMKHKGPVKAQPGPSSPGPMKHKGPVKAQPGPSNFGLVKREGLARLQLGLSKFRKVEMDRVIVPLPSLSDILNFKRMRTAKSGAAASRWRRVKRAKLHLGYVVDPQPAGLFEDHYEPVNVRKYQKVCLCKRLSDGENVAVKFVKMSPCARLIRIPGYSKPLPAEIALNVLMSKPPRSQFVVEMQEWFESEDNALMVLTPFPCPRLTLWGFVKHSGGRLPEGLAQHFMKQIVTGAKACLDRGIFHQDINSANMMINTETLELKLIDFSDGEFLDTLPRFDMSQYSGRALPCEYQKRRCYLANVSTVWSLGRLLFFMLMGRKAYYDENCHTTDDLIFDSTLSEKSRDLMEMCLIRNPVYRATFQQVLQHKWFEMKFKLQIPELQLPNKKRAKVVKIKSKPPFSIGYVELYEQREKMMDLFDQFVLVRFNVPQFITKPVRRFLKIGVERKSRAIIVNKPEDLFDKFYKLDPNRQYDLEKILKEHRNKCILLECIRLKNHKRYGVKLYPKLQKDVYAHVPGTTFHLKTQVAAHVLMKQYSRSPNVIRLNEVFESNVGFKLIWEWPHSCKTLRTYIRRRGGRLCELHARELIIQAVMGAKDCLDLGVTPASFASRTILINSETLELKLTELNYRETIRSFDKDFDASQYSGTGKELPQDYYTRRRYHEDVAAVWGLGRLLHEMVNGCWPRRDWIAGTLTFHPSLSKECQDLIRRCMNCNPFQRATIKQVLEHEWFGDL